MDALYLVDGSGFIFRAYHALPPLSTAQGIPTGAVYGFTQMLIKLEQDHRPSHLAVVFDAGRASFRDQIYAEYKAHRPAAPDDLVVQFARVREVVSALHVPQIELPGYEADDVIATLARRAREAGLKVVIVSSDKDLMQLVDEDLCLVDTMKKEQRIGPAEVEAKFGVPPARVGDVLALMGDSVDNVPGVEGIGPKTATALIQHFGDLEALLSRLDEVPKVPKLRGAERIRELLTTHVESARISRRLVSLDEEVPVTLSLDDLRRVEPEMDRVERLFRALEFERLLERLRPKTSEPDGAGAMPAAPPQGGGETPPERAPTEASVEVSALEARPVRVIGSLDSLAALVAELRARAEVGIAIEATDAGRFSTVCGIGLAADGVEDTYLPLGHRYIGAPPQVPVRDALAALRPLFSDERVGKHVHGYKLALVAMSALDLPLAGVVGDPELSAYLLDPAGPRDLATLATRYGLAGIEEREAVCGSGKRANGYEMVEIARAARYAARRAHATLAVSPALRREVAAAGMAALLDEMELPLSRVLAVIERHGIRLDTARLAAVGEELSQKLRVIEDEVRALVGYEVNLGSPKQLQELLFDKLQLPAVKKTKTGYSTDAEVLEELAPLHPVAAKIHAHRGMAKLKSTYVDALPSLVDPRTGRLHTSYDQTGAATGRISSSEPNLQNIPIRSEVGKSIRRAFVADPGHLLIAADYSQIELRVLAHLSRDQLLLDAFVRGQDVHERTACEVFGVAPDAVTGEMRRVAKAINYGLVYGQTDYGLARTINVPREEARKYISGYFARYTGVAAYMERLIADAQRDGGARTLLGRFRPLPELQSKNRNLRLYAERMARNTPIQGSAADVLKQAMIATQARLDGDRGGARMLLTVHDELVLEAPRAEAERIGELVRQAMEGVWTRDPPLRVEVGIGDNWAEC